MKTLGFKYKENYYELTREKTLKFYGDFVDTIMQWYTIYPCIFNYTNKESLGV